MAEVGLQMKRADSGRARNIYTKLLKSLPIYIEYIGRFFKTTQRIAEQIVRRGGGVGENISMRERKRERERETNCSRHLRTGRVLRHY